MSKTRLATLRVPLLTLLGCATMSLLGSLDCSTAQAQTPQSQHSTEDLEIPFAWTIDPPVLAADVLRPEDLPAGMQLPPGILRSDGTEIGNRFAEPALIETISAESDATTRPIMRSPHGTASSSAAASTSVSSFANRTDYRGLAAPPLVGAVARPVTVGALPSSLAAPKRIASAPLAMPPRDVVPPRDAIVERSGVQPTVQLARSATSLSPLLQTAANPLVSRPADLAMIRESETRDAILSGFIDSDQADIDDQSPPNFVGQPDHRPKILYQPAVPTWDPETGTLLRPNVYVTGSFDPDHDSISGHLALDPSSVSSLTLAPSLADERIAIPDDFVADQTWVPSDFGSSAASFRQRRRKPFVQLYHGIVDALQSQAGRDLGVGIERLPFALFEIDAAQPSNSFRFRFEQAYDWESPDRVEYLWSRVGRKGPPLAAVGGFEPALDYQDLRIAMEIGGARFSATTEIPLRFIDPVNLGNTGGMGDMSIITKTVMMDGETFQLTQVLRTQMPTGSAKRGLGNGHVSMEPGFVSRYQWDCRTQIHNELKLWFPIGGEPGFSGPVLRYGMGFARVLYDSDRFAIIPTFECVGWSILTGQKSVGALNPQSIDGENIINFYPGIRIVRDSDSQLGMFELGIGGGASVTERHWYSSALRLDLRWTF